MAGRIPSNFIDELLARSDIVELIDAYVPLKKRGKEHVACCPFHNEKTPSFTVSAEKQFYHCFGCGAHGTALGFLMEYEHLDFLDAVEALAQRLGLEVPREGGKLTQDHGQDDYALLLEVARFYKHQLKLSAQAIEYLKRRGLSGQIAADYLLGWAPPQWDALIRHFEGKAKLEQLQRVGLVVQKDAQRPYDRFRNRIMFPIRDRQGRVIGFGGRVLDDGTPKYLNSPETALFHKGEVLYGLYEATRQGKLERVLIVEGYMDVVALAQHGIANVVATLGTATTRQHLQALFRRVPEVVFCFDGDRAGREAAWRAVEPLLVVFHDGLDAKFLFLPEGEDPDSLIRQDGPERFVRRVGDAKPLLSFLFEHLTEDLDLGAAAGRARLAEAAKPLLARLSDGVFKELAYQQLGDLVGVAAEHLMSAGAERKARAQPGLGKPVTHTPVRLAIALLLQDPELAQRVKVADELRDLSLPGMSLLVDIIETMRQNPHLSAAALIERYRDSKHHKHLLKLMQWAAPRGEGYDHRLEFDGVIRQLSMRVVEQRTDQLLQKERATGLSPQEKTELGRLLKGAQPPGA